MDVQTALIGGAVFIVSAGILLFIAMFGMKEKSYEEALAEQRRQTNLLLGSHIRPKPKEKKAKKANKKVKEKQTVVVPETETAEESEDTESPSTSSTSSAQQAPQKLHVEFKETVNVAEADDNVTNKKKRKKKDKVRSILMHKDVDNPVGVDIIEVASANHFELLHPKDDFELLQSHLHIKEEPSKEPKEKAGKVKQSSGNQEVAKEKGNKTRPVHVENKDKQEQIKEKNVKKEEKQTTVVDGPQKTNKPVKAPVVDKPEPTVEIAQTNEVVSNVVKEKKKKNENNSLQKITGSKDGDINLAHLLNVVRNAELSRSEVQILIDLLLNKQHEAPAVVDEWSEGKADPVQKLKKQLAEKEKALAEEQEALVGAQAKLREIRNEQVAEKSQLQQRTRSLEEALQAKHLELQAINNRWHNQSQKMQQMQVQLNEESLVIRKLREENGALQLQRKQLDMHLVQSQEAEATIQDLQGRNNQLSLELHSLTEQLAAKEHQQSVMVQLQHQVNHYKGELDDKENFIRQFEDIRRDFEHRLGAAHRQENELKVEISQLNSVCQQHVEEMRRIEHGKNQAFEEIKNLQNQKEELQHNLAQLKRELLDAQAEQSLKANGLAEEDQNHREELLNLHNELSSVKSELQHLKATYTVELEASKNSCTLLESELNEQKNKNNDLRKKNWKVIDALKAAESKFVQDSVKNVPKNNDEFVSRVRSEAQSSNIEFVERLFPEIKISENASYDTWIAEMGSAIEKYVSELEKSKANDSQAESKKLQAQVQHYKTIIDETEGILKQLQNHIEQEEIHWRREITAKELEIEGLKQHYFSELHKKVAEMELQLNAEQAEKQKLSEQLKSRPADEKEVNLSKDKSVDVEASDICLKEQNSAATNGSSVDT